MNDNPTQAHKMPGKGTDPQVHKGEHSPSLAEPSVNMHIEYAVE